MGAFVLPNKEIPDEADLRGFIAPGEWLVSLRSEECGVAYAVQISEQQRATGSESSAEGATHPQCPGKRSCQAIMQESGYDWDSS